MYVEAICPVCLTSHIVPADLRGQRYRCDQCEEVFVINKKSKTTDKRPPRPREVRPADDPDVAVKARPATVILPEADDAPTAKAGADEDAATNVPQGAVRRDPPVGRTAPPAERRASGDDEGEERPRKRPLRRRGMSAALAAGLGAGAVLLIGLIAFGLWWALADRGDKAEEQAKVVNPPDAPRVIVPQFEPARPEPLVWKVKADPPTAPVKLPADFKKELLVPDGISLITFPTAAGSPFVLINGGAPDADARQVWNLETDKVTGRLAGTKSFHHPFVVSPDGAHLAAVPHMGVGEVDVYALGPGTAATASTGLWPELLDFAGPGKLVTGERHGPGLRVQVWDATTGARRCEFDGPAVGRVQMGGLRDLVAISPGGAYLAAVTSDNFGVWDLKTGAVVGERPLPAKAGDWAFRCHSLSFAPDGTELAALFLGRQESRLICWDLAGGDVAFDITFAPLTVAHGTIATYLGHVLGWVGDRRGWLVYGELLIDRPAKKVGREPAGLAAGDRPFRRMVGSNHVATVAGGFLQSKVLTVSQFDPEKPGGR